MNWWDLAGATLLASTMETGFGRSPKHAHCRACAPRHDFGQRQKAMPPGGRRPLLKRRISPSPCRSGRHLLAGPGTLPAQSKRLPGRLHAQESARLAFDPPQASLKLLPIKWSRGLDALFPRLKSPAAEAPSFGYLALRESELFAGGFDTLRETASKFERALIR